MQTRGFTLIELLVVIAVVAVLATLLVVGLQHTGCAADTVRTQSLIQDYKLGVEKFAGTLHRYPFVANADGTLNNDAGTDSAAQGVDDCWRELAPLSPCLTAGLSPTDPAYRNTARVECLSLTRDEMTDPGDGRWHVCDSWHRPFCMQWDYFRRKAMIWSGGMDQRWNISDDPVHGGHSSLFANHAQALAKAPPVITPDIVSSQIDLDLSNY
ncbi:MAG: prepilin-type N-terminal cleavage/methylation domain-containing protein [Planctomycetota bacterium]